MTRLKAMSKALVAKATALDAAQALLDEVETRLATLVSQDAESEPWPRNSPIGWPRPAWNWRPAPSPTAKPNSLPRTPSCVSWPPTSRSSPSGRDFFVEGDEAFSMPRYAPACNLAYGCSSGNCGACKARVVSGEVWKIRDHDYLLSAREKQMGYILACSNTAVTDLVLEAAGPECR